MTDSATTSFGLGNQVESTEGHSETNARGPDGSGGLAHQPAGLKREGSPNPRPPGVSAPGVSHFIGIST